jgi:predicted HNH restriction endonuclease
MPKVIKYADYIPLWKAGLVSGNRGIIHIDVSANVRRYLLERCGNTCEECGWGAINPFTGKVTLEVHHIDGDYQNSREENLKVLCPNCHSLTYNYRARNKSGLAQSLPKKR